MYVQGNDIIDNSAINAVEDEVEELDSEHDIDVDSNGSNENNEDEYRKQPPKELVIDAVPGHFMPPVIGVQSMCQPC
jgi:hypothetical protein